VGVGCEPHGHMLAELEPLHLTETMRNMIRVFYDVTTAVSEPYVEGREKGTGTSYPVKWTFLRQPICNTARSESYWNLCQCIRTSIPNELETSSSRDLRHVENSRGVKESCVARGTED